MSKMIQKLEQRQKLNPKQIIEANLMQLNYYNLEKRITKEIEDNPILEIEEENSEDPTTQENDDGFHWDELISNPEDYSTYSKKEIYESSSSVQKLSLYDDFVVQLNDLNIVNWKREINKIRNNINKYNKIKKKSYFLSKQYTYLKRAKKILSDINIK